jgi:cytochrome c oxidase assembly factor CtaG
MVAAPLFALSAPLDLATSASGPRFRALVASRPVQILLHPLVGFGLYFVFIPATHLTSFFNLMLEHEWIHHGEQIAFLFVGYLFFRPAFGIEEGAKIHPGLRLVYVMAAVPVDTFTGLALVMQSQNPFPAYAVMGPSSATSTLNNIHLGGAIMWIGGDALMLLALIPIAVAWVKSETIKTRELDKILDAAGI